MIARAPHRPGGDTARRRQSGQAMPLAAIGLLAMTLAILATLNLGQAVHQKIKLQNTADAAAYTLAAMEARTFNYIAFLNRAQIAHYNTAMAVQSYVTWVGYQVAHFGAAVDLFTVLKDDTIEGYNKRTECKDGDKCLWVPAVISVRLLAPLMEGKLKAAVSAYKEGAKLAHELVEAISIFNRDIIWKAQFTRAALLNVHLLTGMQNHIEKMDPDISFSSGSGMLINLLVNTALNSIEYYQTFDNAAGVNPFIYGIVRDYSRVFPNWDGSYNRPDKEGKVGYSIMAEMCNATRTPGFISSRSEHVYVSLNMMHNVQASGHKMGQTKFTDSDGMTGAMVPSIYDMGNYPVGKYLSSNDYSTTMGGSAVLTMLPAFAMDSFTTTMLGDAITAYKNDGKHLRYKEGGGGTGTYQTTWGATGDGPDSETENHAPWKGFAPYFKFNAKADRTADYNQPSTWIFLNKHHEDFQTGEGSHPTTPTRAPWLSQFEWRSGDQVALLDTTVGGSRNSYLFEGLNVVSRGMAYYHRPGNWKEHPNFFNPYWRARLAPVGQKLQSFWDRWVTGSISTSSDNQVVKGLVSLLKGAQMDLFTAVITSMITH